MLTVSFRIPFGNVIVVLLLIHNKDTASQINLANPVFYLIGMWILGFEINYILGCLKESKSKFHLQF